MEKRKLDSSPKRILTQAQVLRPKSGGCELFLLVLLIGGRRYAIKVSMVTDDVLSF